MQIKNLIVLAYTNKRKSTSCIKRAQKDRLSKGVAAQNLALVRKEASILCYNAYTKASTQLTLKRLIEFLSVQTIMPY